MPDAGRIGFGYGILFHFSGGAEQAIDIVNFYRASVFSGKPLSISFLRTVIAHFKLLQAVFQLHGTVAAQYSGAGKAIGVLETVLVNNGKILALFFGAFHCKGFAEGNFQVYLKGAFQ